MSTVAGRAVRVVVADDHQIWRAGMRADLGESFAVVGEAEDAPGAIETARRERPDLVLCDLNMPGGGGMAVVQALAAELPVVVLTVSESERDLLDVVAAGAVGYLLKSTRSDDLRASLMRAAEGEPVFSPQLAALLIGVGVAWIAEPLLGFALSFWSFGRDHIAPYLPSSATNAVVNGVQSSSDAVVLSWWVAALVLAAWAAVLAGAGIARTVRQDVS